MDKEENIMALNDAEIMRLRAAVQDLQDNANENAEEGSDFGGDEWPVNDYSEANAFADSNKILRFKVVKTATTSVKVLAGTWTRFGVPLSIVDTTIASLTAGPYYITATLADAASPTGLDPALKPQRLLVTSEAAAPSADTFNFKVLLAVVTCAASVITSISQRRVGDIDDDVFKPDSEMGSPKQSETIVIDATTGESRLRNAEATASRDKYAKLNTSNQLTWAAVTGLPSSSGKSQYMVLQLDAGLLAIWDWTRAHA